MSMRNRLLLPSAAIFVLLTGYLLLIWLPKAHAHAESLYRESVLRHLHSVAAGLAPLLSSNKMSRLNGMLDGLLETNPEWKSIVLFDEHGDRIYPLNRPVPSVQSLPDQRNDQNLRQPVMLQDKHLADMVVQVDFQSALAAVKSDQRQVVLAIIVTLSAVLILLWRRIGAQIQRPVEELTHFTSALAQGNTKACAPQVSADEMSVLVARMSTLGDLVIQHQTQLMHEPDRLEQVNLHNEAEAVISTDTQGNIRYLNTAAERLTGWDNDEAVGLPLDLVLRVHGDRETDDEASHSDGVMQTDEAACTTTSLIHRLGHVLPITLTRALLRGTQGEVSGTIVVFRECANPN